MKSYSFKHMHIFTLFLLLVPCLTGSLYADSLQYNSLDALLKDFANPASCPGASCTDFVQALKNLIAVDKNPKYKNQKAQYDRFIADLEQKIRTRNATLIAAFLLQGERLFPEVRKLLSGRKRDDIINIIKTRLK